MQSIEEDKAISGTILNQVENTASRYKLNNVTQKEKDMTERAWKNPGRWKQSFESGAQFSKQIKGQKNEGGL